MKKTNILFLLATTLFVNTMWAQSTLDTSSSIGLEEVKVISSYATDRKTPVAVSTVSSRQIAETVLQAATINLRS